MRERCEGEEKRNRAAMAKVEPVIYGGIIQLYHVKSAGELACGKMYGQFM